MSQQIIDLGTGPDSQTGDDLYTAFTKVNDNFTELYSVFDGNGITEINANVIVSNNIWNSGNVRTNEVFAYGNIETVSYIITAGAFYPNGVQIGSLGSVTSNIVPISSGIYDIGSENYTFSNLYLSNSVVISGANIAVDSGLLFIDGLPVGNYSNTNVASYLPIYEGNTAAVLTTTSQPYITQLGTLTSLDALTANINGNLLVNGNLSVEGNITYFNIRDLSVVDPIVSLNTGPNGSPLIADNGFDSGIKTFYYDTQNKESFFGRINSSGYFEYYSNVISEIGNIISGTYGTIKTGNLILTSNADITGNVTADYFNGNGRYLTDINSIYDGNSNISVQNSGPITVSSQGTSNVAIFTSNGVNVGGDLYVTGTISATQYIGNVSGNITAPGNDTEIIFNDGGLLSASSGLTFTSSTNSLSVSGNLLTSSNIVVNGFTVIDDTGNVITARLENSGVVVGTYGNASAVPIVTVDEKGRITDINTTPVAGVSNVSYDISDSNLSIFTSAGTIFSVNLGVGTNNDPTFAGVTITGNLFAETANANTIITDGTAYLYNISSTGLSTLTTLDVLGSADITGNIDANNINVANLITAEEFSVTNITATNATLSGNVVADTFYGNIDGTTGTFSGNVATGNISTSILNATFRTYANTAIFGYGTDGSGLSGAPIVISGNSTTSIIGTNGIANNVSSNLTIKTLNNNISLQLSGVDKTWTFDTTGDLTAPGNVTATRYLTTGNSVAVGERVGLTNQGSLAVAVGSQAGQTNQGLQATAVGSGAGNDSQGLGATAVGTNAGAVSQGNSAVAIGVLAGSINQSNYAVAVGDLAGATGQGAYAIAMGYYAGPLNQPANSIILNASGSSFTGNNAGFYVNPVRNDTSNISEVVTFNTSTKELTYSNTISFSGNVTAGNLISDSVYATTIGNSGTLLTGTLTTASQPNITSVGSTLTVGEFSFLNNTIFSTSDTITIEPANVGSTGNVIIEGNLRVTGNVTYIDSTVVSINDKDILLANNTSNISDLNGAGILIGNDDGVNLVTLKYSTTLDSWQTNVGFSPVGNVNLDLGTNTTYWANLFVDNINSTTISGTLQTSNQPNVTSLGTLSGLSVNGEILGINVTANSITINNSANIGSTLDVIGNVTAPYFIGNVIGNITGNLSAPGNNTEILFNDNGLISGDSGITYNKTTDGLTVAGNIVSGNLSSTNVTATNFIGTTVNATSGTFSGNVSTGNVSGTNLTGTNLIVTDITATTGTFSGNVITGNVSGTNITGTSVNATTGAFSGNISADTLNGNIVGTTGTFSGNVSTGNVSGTNIVGTNALVTTLSALTGVFSGNVISGNVNTNNVIGTSISITTGSFSGNVSTGNISGTNITGTNVIATTGTFSGNVSSNNLVVTNNIQSSTISITANASFGNISTSGLISTTNSTDATSNVTGAVTITGGLGVGKNMYVGNAVGWVYANSVSAVYQVFNPITNSLDTIFG